MARCDRASSVFSCSETGTNGRNRATRQQPSNHAEFGRRSVWTCLVHNREALRRCGRQKSSFGRRPEALRLDRKLRATLTEAREVATARSGCLPLNARIRNGGIRTCLLEVRAAACKCPACCARESPGRITADARSHAVHRRNVDRSFVGAYAPLRRLSKARRLGWNLLRECDIRHLARLSETHLIDVCKACRTDRRYHRARRCRGLRERIGARRVAIDPLERPRSLRWSLASRTRHQVYGSSFRGKGDRHGGIDDEATARRTLLFARQQASRADEGKRTKENKAANRSRRHHGRRLENVRYCMSTAEPT